MFAIQSVQQEIQIRTYTISVLRVKQGIVTTLFSL